MSKVTRNVAIIFGLAATIIAAPGTALAQDGETRSAHGALHAEISAQSQQTLQQMRAQILASIGSAMRQRLSASLIGHGLAHNAIDPDGTNADRDRIAASEI